MRKFYIFSLILILSTAAGVAQEESKQDKKENPELESIMFMFDRVQKSLSNSIKGLNQEQLNWRMVDEDGDGYKNSIAMLVNHILDTEQFLIGYHIGGEDVEFDHGEAFEVDNATQETLQGKIDATKKMLSKVLDELTDQELNEDGVKFGDTQLDKRQTLLQSMLHASTHIGQITVLKRLQGIR